jgi:predicted PurR-regulated permease PerM
VSLDPGPDGSPLDPARAVGTAGQPIPDGVPFWLVRLSAIGWRSLVIVAFALVVLAIAATISTVTASVLVAFLASTAVAPLVTALRGRGWGGGRAAAVGTLLVAAVIVLILAVVAYVLVAYGPDLLKALRSGADALRSGDLGQFLPPAVAAAVADVVDSAVRWLGSNAVSLVGRTANVLTILLFAGFTMFYVLQDFGSGWRWATQGMSERHREAAAKSAWLAVNRIGGYLRRTTIISLVEAVIVLGLLVVLGVDLPIPLAILVFAGGFVPYVGAIATTTAVLLVALQSIGPAWTLLLFVLIVVLNLVSDRLLGSRLERVGARVNPAIVLISLPIGAAAGGLFGLVLAVPTAAALLAVGTSLVDIVRPDEPATDTSTEVVPPWLDLLAQWSWRLLVAIALLGVGLLAILQVPGLLLPIIIAAVLAATLVPIVGWLMRRGLRRNTASLVATAGLTGVIAVLTVLSVVYLVGGVVQVAGGIGDGAAIIDDFLQGLGGSLEELVDSIAGGIVDAALVATVSAAILAIIVIVGVVLTYFLLNQGRAAWELLTSRMAPWRRKALDEAGSEAVGVLGGYMLGTGAVSLFGAATQWALMFVFGVPLALPVFVLSFFGGYIPYIGSAITTGIAFLLTITTGDPVAIVVMLAFTAIFNVVQGSVIQPIVFSRAVNIHPAIVLLAIPAGGTLGGILGMFLVVPFIGVIAATWRTVLVVLGQPPAPGTPDGGDDDSAAAAAATEAEPAAGGAQA